MEFAAARSRLVDSDDAVEEILHSLRGSLNQPPDFAALFITTHHRAAAARIADRIHMSLEPNALIGCTCEGVIGVDEEIEREPGISALIGSLPGVTLNPFHLHPQEWNDALTSPEVLESMVGSRPDTRGYLILGDPFTTPIEDLLASLDRLPGRAPTFGGMASGAYQPGGNALIQGDELHTEGCVGVAFSGPIQIQTVVSQGCRPVGERYLVTGAHDNIIGTLGGVPALDVAEEVISTLRDEERFYGADLFLGIAIDEYKEVFTRGDFLIRNLLGGDRQSGTIAVGDVIRPGQTVQFHVRDAGTAGEDLHALLYPLTDSESPSGGLLFSCNGRGTRMFDAPCHDIRAGRELLPRTPIAGFFTMGELGPIGGRSYIHGHTASFALFSSAEEDSSS